MHTKWRWLAGVAAGAAAMTITLLSGSTAHASTRVTAPPAKPAATATPAASKYDNTDPNKTGCAKGSYTKWSHRIFRGSTVVGNVELRYSPHCRTVWSRVTRVASGYCYAYGYQADCTVPEIVRNSDGAKAFAPSGYGEWGNYAYSLQLNDSGVTSHASGQVFDSSAPDYYRSGRTASW